METKKITKVGIFAAIVFLATRFLMIGLPIGYVHLGDVTLCISAVVLGGPLGGLATAIGASLADLSSGYHIYAIPTFIIKFLQVLFIGKIFDFILKSRKNIKIKPMFFIICLCSNIIMVTGYFLYEWVLFGYEPAFVNIAPNILQGTLGALVSLVFLNTALNLRKV